MSRVQRDEWKVQVTAKETEDMREDGGRQGDVAVESIDLLFCEFDFVINRETKLHFGGRGKALMIWRRK